MLKYQKNFQSAYLCSGFFSLAIVKNKLPNKYMPEIIFDEPFM